MYFYDGRKLLVNKGLFLRCLTFGVLLFHLRTYGTRTCNHIIDIMYVPGYGCQDRIKKRGVSFSHIGRPEATPSHKNMSTSITALLIAAVALAAAATGVVSAQETDTAPYDGSNVIISLAEWNTILMTESSADYGAYDSPTPLSPTLQESIWSVATLWQWQYNQLDRTSTLGGGYNFAPYAVCSSVPGLSGAERFEAIAELLRAAAIAEGTVLFAGDSLYNDADRTCRAISAETATFKAVIDSQPEDVLQYLQVQPLLSSMKQIEGTFQGIMDAMAAVDCAEDDRCEEESGGGTATVTVGTFGGRGRALQEEMALIVILSPIVLHFTRTGELTYQEAINEMMEFAT